MLPDWPDIKDEIHRALMRFVKRVARARSAAGLAVAVTLPEGHGTRMARGDGTVEEGEFERATAEVTLPFEAIETGSMEGIVEKLVAMADQLAQSTDRTMLKTIEEGVRSVGNEINAGGRPFSADLLIDALERMDVEFDRSGEPSLPTIIFHPQSKPQLVEQLQRLETDTDVKARYRTVLTQQRENWRDREARRILAE